MLQQPCWELPVSSDCSHLAAAFINPSPGQTSGKKLKLVSISHYNSWIPLLAQPLLDYLLWVHQSIAGLSIEDAFEI